MFIKIFLVTEVLETGGERVLAARLTHEAARAVAKKGGNRKVTKLFATKSTEEDDAHTNALTDTSITVKGEENDYRTECCRNRQIRT
jgi:hypothetical protein